jgi:hypothetical protein
MEEICEHQFTKRGQAYRIGTGGGYSHGAPHGLKGLPAIMQKTNRLETVSHLVVVSKAAIMHSSGIHARKQNAVN